MDEGEQQKPSDLTELRNSLEKSFSCYLKEFVSKDDPSIISIGSGFGYEAGALQKIYPNMSYLGIDKNEQYQFGATKINKDIPGDIRFVTADARDPAFFENRNWNIVLLRHPQVQGSVWSDEMGNVRDWETILHNSAQAVSKDGIMVVTSDSEEEVAIIKRILSKSGINILIDEINKFPSKGTPHRDFFIIIGKKQS